MFVLFCGLLDRLIGWGGFGRTKPVIFGIIGLGLISYFLGLPLATCLTIGIAFMIWRTPPWKIFGGSLDPKPNELLGTFARHLLALIFVIPAYYAGVPIMTAVAGMTVFAIIATLLGFVNNKIGNDKVEIARGALLGLILTLIMPT